MLKKCVGELGSVLYRHSMPGRTKTNRHLLNSSMGHTTGLRARVIQPPSPRITRISTHPRVHRPSRYKVHHRVVEYTDNHNRILTMILTMMHNTISIKMADIRKTKMVVIRTRMDILKNSIQIMTPIRTMIRFLFNLSKVMMGGCPIGSNRYPICRLYRPSLTGPIISP